MKPAPFDYLVARSVREAVSALAERPSRARVLAGGQSLVLEMNYRRERPALLVDINHVPDLDGIEVEGGELRVGALARHRDFEEPVARDPLGRLLERVSRHIAHPPIRARGTMVGSLAYAHPAAEWPAVAVALDARLELAGPEGVRTVRAGEFFRGPFATARRPGEMITGVRLPLLGEGSGAGFVELRRTKASFALVAALAAITVEGGVITSSRIALAGAADRPLRARGAEEALAGNPPSDETFAEAERRAALEADPVPEPHAGVEYRRHAAGVLVRRALERAVEDLEVNS